MNENPFDAFDQQDSGVATLPPTPEGNPFDQFDGPATVGTAATAVDPAVALAPESAAASAARAFKAKFLPAVGTALGGGLAGLVATPESVGLATIPAAIAGGAAGGAAGEKAYEYLMGDEDAKRERAQIALNEQAHPWASTAGGAIPTLLSLVGGGGLVKTLGAKAAQGLEGAAAQEAIKKATSGVGAKIAEASLTGARLGASETAQRAVQGDDVGVADFADSMARDAVAFGPFGLLPHVEQLGKALGMAIPQAYLSTIAGAAYDSMVHGKPFDVKDVAGHGTAEVVPFALFNAIAHGVQAGHKRFVTTKAQNTAITAADSAEAAGMPQAAQVLRDLAARAAPAPAPPRPSPSETQSGVETGNEGATDADFAAANAKPPAEELPAEPAIKESPPDVERLSEVVPGAEPSTVEELPVVAETPSAPPEIPVDLASQPTAPKPAEIAEPLAPVEQPQPPISPEVLRGTSEQRSPEQAAVTDPFAAPETSAKPPEEAALLRSTADQTASLPEIERQASPSDVSTAGDPMAQPAPATGPPPPEAAPPARTLTEAFTGRKKPASWVIRRRGTKEVVREITNEKLIAKLKPEFEAIPIADYLAGLNKPETAIPVGAKEPAYISPQEISERFQEASARNARAGSETVREIEARQNPPASHETPSPALAAEEAKPEPVKQKQPLNPTAAREQKKFLLTEIESAIKEAPKKLTPEQQDVINKLRTPQPRAPGYPPEKPLPRQLAEGETKEAWEIEDEKHHEARFLEDAQKWETAQEQHKKDMAQWEHDMQAAKQLARAQIGHVRIEIPGDGTFDILNTAEALKEFQKRAQKFPVSTAKPDLPANERPLEATPIPAVKKPATHQDVVDAITEFASSDETRAVLNGVYSNGEQMVATDGRRIIVVDRKGPGTEKKPAFFDLHGKARKPSEVAKWTFPRWQQVIPDIRGYFKIGELDTGRMFSILSQARALTKGEEREHHAVILGLNPDGSIGIRKSQVDTGDYEHNLQDGVQVLAAFDNNYLLDIMRTARALGHEKVEMHMLDDISPGVFTAKDMKVVLMPMRISDSIGKMENTKRIAELMGQDKPKRTKGKAASEPPAKSSASPVDRSVIDESESAGQDKADDRPAGLFKLEYRDEKDLSEPERRALESVRAGNHLRSVQPVEGRPLAEGEPPERAAGNRYREALKDVFRKTVLFVDAESGPNLDFDAASPASARNVILMDARSLQPVLHLTGHELVHAMKAQQPEVWASMRDDLMALAGDWSAHRKALEELGYKAGQMEDEFLADFVGGQFRNPDFWARAAERNPTLFGRLARTALDILNMLIDRVKGLGRDVAPYFKDLQAAREVVLDALEKYSAGPMPERDMTVGPDVDFSLKAKSPSEEDASPEKVYGFYNAAMDAERERLGMELAERAPYMSVEDLHSEAHRELVADPTKPERILDEMETDKRPLTAEEDALLRQYGVELQMQLDATPEGDPRHAAVYDKLDRLLRNVIASGSRQGQAFRMRQTLLDRQFDVAGLARRWMAITGKSLTPAEWAHIRKEAAEFKELNDADKQAAYSRLKKTSQDEIERLHQELKAQDEASSGWLDEALDALNDADRQNVDAVLAEVQFLHELATQSAASGIDFSLKADQRTAANRARLEEARARVAALGKLTPEVVAKAKAEASARLAKLRKTFADPAASEAIDKAVGGDKTALKLLESLKQPKARTTKSADPVKRRFADEVRKLGPVEKFVADLTATGVSKENAERLHAEAVKKSQRLASERATRQKVRKAVDETERDEEPDAVTPLDEITKSLSAGEKDITKVPVSLLRNAVRTLVASGLRGDEQVMPALTKLVNEAGIKATEEQVRERAVNYGHAPTPKQDEPDKSTREALSEALKVASIKRVENQKPLLKTGQQRDKPHQKLRELFKVLKEKMRAAGISPRTSEQQLASVEDATLTRLRNDIEDLQAQIDAGARAVRNKTPAAHTQKFLDEQTRLKEQKQRLVEALDSLDPAKPMTPEEREARLIRAAERSAEHWRNRLKNAEWEDRAKPGPPSEKVLAARENAAAMKELFEQARDLARPDLKKDPEALALARYNRLLDRREADLARRMSEKDYSKPIRNQTALDDATAKRKIAFERKLRQFNADARDAADQNRTPAQKFWDFMVKMKRSFVLTYPAVIGKLTAASLTRGFTTLSEELAGGAMGRLLPSDFTTGPNRARIEGGVLKAAGYVEAAKNWHMKWIDDMKKTFALGESDLDVVGSKQPHEKPDIWGLPGRIHAAIKAPIKRALYEFAMAKQIQSYLEDGHDPADLRDGELLHMRMAANAYKYAERGIFLNDNVLVGMFNSMVRTAEAQGGTGKGIARAMRVLMPIVKVPTNIIAESFQMVGGLPIGLVRLAKAWHTGFDKLDSDERESILRTMKKGSLGAGLVLFGYYSNNPAFQAGGYYNHDDKRKPGDPKVGGFKLFGVEVPHWLTHAPAFEAIQFGATIRRAQNNSKHGNALPPATMAALLGLAEETPFLNEMFRIKDLQTETGRGKFFAELAKAQVVPGLVQQVANWTDRARPLEPTDLLTGDGTQARRPNGFTEIMESGVPGLRQKLSYKVDSPFSPRRAEEIPEVLHQYAQHGNPMPSLPERTPLEKKLGHPISNPVWNAYTDIRGRAIERLMLHDIGYLSSPADEKEKKRRVSDIAKQASYEARQALGLK